MNKIARVRVAVITPHYDTKPTPHCARINDALNTILEIHPEIELEVLSVSALDGGNFFRLKALLLRSSSMVRRSDLVHIVSFLPAFALIRLMAGKRPIIVGPNITGASFPKSFLGDKAIEALKIERPGHWRRWYLGGGALREAINVRFLAGTNRVFTLSNYASDIVASRGFPRHRLNVLPFAAPRIESAKGDVSEISYFTRPRIVYIGRLDRRKGFDTFLDLVRTFPHSGSFHVFGDGPLRANACELANDNKCLVLHGKKSREELLKHLPYMDLYVQPSTYEAIATTVFEALRAGIPVLSSDIEAHQEASRALPGIRLYKSSDPEDAKEQLSDMIKELEVAKSEARKAGPLLDPSIAAEWLVRLYKDVAVSN